MIRHADDLVVSENVWKLGLLESSRQGAKVAWKGNRFDERKPLVDTSGAELAEEAYVASVRGRSKHDMLAVLVGPVQGQVFWIKSASYCADLTYITDL